MVKYCVRKSFKHITNKMRAANKIAYANMENNEVVAAYFEQNCEGDISISMPFKYRWSLTQEIVGREDHELQLPQKNIQVPKIQCRL